MNEKMHGKGGPEMQVQFRGTIEFEGTVSEFKAALAGLEKLSARGIKIGTWPTPEHPGSGMMIDTVPLPERGTAGIWPVVRHLDQALLSRLTDGKPKFKLIEGINGGIRCAHLHMKDEVVLIDQAGFKDAVRNVAADLTSRLADVADYPEVVGAVSHLDPSAR